MVKTYGPTEDQIQESIFQWLSYQKFEGSQYIHAIPNGGHRHVITAVRLKRTGTKKGVLDICWLKRTKHYSGFVCEVKRPGQKPTEEQENYAAWCKSQGFYTCLVYSLEDFQIHIQNFLDGEKNDKR